MATSLENFPLALVTDGFLSYLKHIFGSSDHTPSDYRWDKDDRASRITIVSPFVIDNEKPNSVSYITVERGGYGVDNRVLDNLKSSSENVFDITDNVMLTNGTVNLTIGTGVASEASSIANYLMIQLQSDRSSIMEKLGFLRRMQVVSVGPEIPQFKDSKVSRWTVTLTIETSIQMGWIKSTPGDTWESFEVRAINRDGEYKSTTGSLAEGSSSIIDAGANFGYDINSEPSFIKSEVEKGWYTIKLPGSSVSYVLEGVVSPTELIVKDLLPESDSSGVEYSVYWNDVHLHVKS